MEISFSEKKRMDKNELKALYEDAEWFAYTQDLVLLEAALAHSLYVLSAWDGSKLAGLVRVVGDGLTIIYIQDILILKSHQNRGIATHLMTRVLDKFKAVRQKVLLTDEAPDVRHFYEKNGFQSCDSGELVAFAKMS